MTSSRAILFDDGAILAQKGAEFPQIFPQDGWVEHDPEAIWDTTLDVTSAWKMQRHVAPRRSPSVSPTSAKQPLSGTAPPARQSIMPSFAGSPHCRYCKVMQNGGHEPTITAKTGLLLDPISPHQNLHGFRQRGWRTNAPPPSCVSAQLTVSSSGA